MPEITLSKECKMNNDVLVMDAICVEEDLLFVILFGGSTWRG